MGIEEVMVWIWLGVFVIAIIVESLAPGLVSIWFAGGAVISLILSIIPGVPFWVEILVFLVVSITLIFATRPLTQKYLFKKEIRSNVEEKIGEKCIVLLEISELSHGEVRLNDIVWTAIAKNKEDVFLKDEVVVIVGVEGNKLVVDKNIKEN